MASTIQARQVVRAQPYGTQITFVAAVVPDTDTLSATFDIQVIIADRNQAALGVINALQSVGPYLDVMVFSTGIGTIDVTISVDTGGGFRSMLVAPIAVAVSVMTTINQLRIPARYGNVTFTNTSGGDATVDFGAYVRSN